MHRISASARIALGLALLSTSGILLLHTLGFGPRQKETQLKGRQRLAEMLAIDASLLITRNDMNALRSLIVATEQRYADVQAVTVRDRSGRLVQHAGHIKARSGAEKRAIAAADLVTMPLVCGKKQWGHVTLQFKPLAPRGLVGALYDPFLQLVFLLTIGNLVMFVLYLKKTLQHLDPSRVVPDHVRNAFDTIAAGLVIVDNHERIVLANREFTQSAGIVQADLLGKKLSRLDWQLASEERDGRLPWQQTLADGTRVMGVTLRFRDKSGTDRAYIVNCAPVLTRNQERRGVLISFENITELETKKAELSRALTVVQSSRDEIRKQNRELQRLATVDPLTGCLNRRSFFEKFESHWSTAGEESGHLSCIMLDIDHFKSVNDNHGHATGDLVLRNVAAGVREVVPVDAVVGRYGGEEFCILLPDMDTDAASAEAENVRRAVERLPFDGLTVTISLGVSSRAFGADTPEALIEQADKCLYGAKHNGRNQVVRWDKMPAIMPELLEVTDASEHDENRAANATDNERIPFEAVAALMAALEYRDRATAKHSRRVADLCVAVGQGLLSSRQCHVLETAALLHDIGKIGIPDSILRKPGPLTDDERQIMVTHDRLGVEMIAGAISSPALIRTVALHHRWYQPQDTSVEGPAGDAIPLEARILAVAEAYDSMTSDSVYRAPLSRAEAIAELRRGAGSQFDPEVVEHFVTWLETTHGPAARPAPMDHVPVDNVPTPFLAGDSV